MLTIYMDESGFTGQDLLSPAQPIFVHASTTLSNEECDEFYKEYFSGTRGLELKHKILSRRSSGQHRIANFIHAVRNVDQFTAFICHKEFTLLTYLVDLWVEPEMHRAGIDLYKDGGNLALCNMAYYCLRTLQNDKFLKEHLMRFQRMMIERTLNSYHEFFGELYRDYRRADVQTKNLLVFFLGPFYGLGYERLSTIPEQALCPALTTAINMCSHWRKRTNAPLKLVHDASSAITKDKWLLDFITSPDIENRIIGPPDRYAVYPLNVVQTEFADSRSHLQLQFCDLVAGAIAAWCRQFIDLSYDKNYVIHLGSAGIEDLISASAKIWPEPEVQPERMGMKGWSGEEIDFLENQLAKFVEKNSSGST